MRRLIIVALLALAPALGGCAEVQKVEAAWTAVTSASVSPTAVVVAANTFDALEQTATNYLRLRRCTPANRPVCREPVATKIIIPAVRSGQAARNNLEQFLADHPGELGNQGTYDALNAAIATLQKVFAQYNIGGAS